MKIYPLPPQLPTNPYLDQLYAPMVAQGMDVRRTRPRYSLPALLLGRGPRILHLHFFDELTQRRSPAATAIRSLLFLALLAALRLCGVRLVWTAHNLEPHELYHPAWGYLVYRLVARWSDAIIAHSYAARALLKQRYGPLPHCTVIPLGNYIGLYGPPRERAASRAALDLPADGPMLLNVGALRPYKNIEGLIDAFAALPTAIRGTLLIAGAAKSPAYAEELRRRVAAVPGVQLRAEFIADADLPAYLAAADLVVLPYRKMLTSAMLLCALSYARPVVAPAFGPVCELLREGREGFLFAPGDDDSLRAALDRALAHPDLPALGETGLAAVREFEWSRIAERTAQLYHYVTTDDCRPITNDQRQMTNDKCSMSSEADTQHATHNTQHDSSTPQLSRSPALPLASLIVVTYNSAASLPAFFEALLVTTYAPYEVLVVDNASHDGTQRIVAEQHREVQLLANDTNLGFGRACNQGAWAARGDILAFLNPDVIVTPDWLTILVRHITEHPDTAILCPQTLYLDERRIANDDIPKIANSRSAGVPSAAVAHSSSRVAETAAVPGCAMVMPRATWRTLGGFDEQIFLYWEDTELCWRAWLLGWRVLEDLDAYVYHERGGSAGGQRWDAERTKNSLYTYLKLMRWRTVVWFALQLAAKTLAKVVLRRQPGLLGAWAWNFRHLGLTLARRRTIADQRRGDPARLARLVAAHAQRGRKARQERRRMVYYRDGKRN